MKPAILILLIALLGTQIARYFVRPPAPTSDWRTDLKEKLPLMGHRNWIVVADSAYPAQSREGIQTVHVGGNQLDVVKEVLAMIAQQKHIKPSIYLDKELDFVAEDDAKGVQTYRADLKKLLGGSPVETLPHENIIAKLDESAKVFNTLVLKTDMTVPYTSVFINLDCAYWDDEKQARLKKAMKELPK